MEITYKVVALLVAGLGLGYVLTKSLHLPKLGNWMDRLSNGRGFGKMNKAMITTDLVDTPADVARMERELGL